MNDLANNNLNNLTEAILASYDMEEKTCRIGETFLPSRSKIVEILKQLQQLLFPGYFGHKKLTDENIRYHVGNLQAKLADELADQIRHCMCTERTCSACVPDPCRHEAEKEAYEFLGRLPKIRSMLAMDAQAAYDGDPAAKSIDEIIYCYPGFYAVTIYRIAHELTDMDIALMPRIMTEYAHSVTGADIHPGAKIGESFFIDHATGVVIGETTHIGDNVKIYQGVTLGALSFPKDERGRVIKGLQRHPTIEDGATVYANATILGGDTVIGKGVTVGGNTFVTSSITPEHTVSHKPAALHVRAKRKK
ncbi:MAG: serine acetyltransferase [Phycisphaerae bacterium]|nr:serine acetyltransferase [Phycisphaerae bacterium]